MNVLFGLDLNKEYFYFNAYDFITDGNVKFSAYYLDIIKNI